MLRMTRLGLSLASLTSMQEICGNVAGRTSSQSERFCTATPKQVSESIGCLRRQKLLILPDSI